MTSIGIMIEGQDGLTWPRWQRILQAAEDFGYQCVFRSDHYANSGPPQKDSLELFVSLTYAASHTQRIEFGSMVAPVTFRHPVLTARMAAQIDDLSGGRMVLGLGAGWNEYEHKTFGVPFYDSFGTRFDMLEEAVEITHLLLHNDEPVSFNGEHFSLDEALLLPRPQRPGGPKLLIGGTGPKRTLPLVAKYASEWNMPYTRIPDYQERAVILNELLIAEGRKPEDVLHSLMMMALYGKDEADLKAKAEKRGTTVEALQERGVFVGTASAIIDQIGAYVEAGMGRFMLQWLDQDDIEGLELMARDVLPHFHK